MVPVLGREGPAAAARPAVSNTARSISIPASEPALTSNVRSQDVAAFQKIGAPYQVNGTWYVPAHEPDYDETGVASWYGADFQGRPTANGEIFDMNVVTAAHPTLPIPSLVEVTNLANGRSIVVRVNDRGPFVGSRLIDLSARGAELLGYQREGHTNVRVRYVGPADSEPMVSAQSLTPARQLAATTSVKPLPAASAPQPVFAQASAAPAAQNSQTASAQAFVQVGAYSQRANADRARDQAISLGPVQVVESQQANGNPLYRVVLGPVSNRAEANEKAQEMSINGFAGARVLASLE
jgi:rare lipoprotein A